MEKSNLGSSVYLSQTSNKINQLSESRRPVRPTRVRVEIVNQNLQEAIRDVRKHIRENPQWNLNVKKVADQYKPKGQRVSIINDTIQELPETHLLPQSAKDPPPNTQDNRKPDFQKMKYTERQRRQYEERMRELQQKRMQFQVNSLEKQMRAKAERKMKENMSLKQKAQLIRDIQMNREERLRLKDKQYLRKKEEQSLLHESNIAKIEMLRRCKKRARKRQLSQSHSQSQQSAIDLKFKEFICDKQKKEVRDIVIARFRTMRSASQGTMRRKMLDPRPTRTPSSGKLQSANLLVQ